MLQVHHSWWEVVCKSSIPTAITSTTHIINWKQGIWMLNFSLFFHNLSHSDGKHNASPRGLPVILPASYLGNNSDTLAFSNHRLSGEFLHSTYKTDTLVWNSGPDMTGTSRPWRMMHGHSLSVVLTVSQINSAHHCHSCMTLYWTDSTSPRELDSSGRWIPNCLIISIQPYFFPSTDVLVSKLDIDTFIEAVNFMIFLYTVSKWEAKGSDHK